MAPSPPLAHKLAIPLANRITKQDTRCLTPESCFEAVEKLHDDDDIAAGPAVPPVGTLPPSRAAVSAASRSRSVQRGSPERAGRNASVPGEASGGDWQL